MEYANPSLLARSGAVISGQVALSKLTRLVPLLESDQGAAAYQLRFEFDEAGCPTATGSIRATLLVICQRCLEPLWLEVASECRFGMVAEGSDLKAAAPDYDTVILDKDRLSLRRLVEDELLLALPAAPMHPAGECSPPPIAQPADGDTGSPTGPLAALRKVKSGGGGSGT